jgi:hypothetical protein
MHKSQINKELYKLPKNATFQVDKILLWIKHNQEVSASLNKPIRLKLKGAIAQKSMREGYIKDMRHYLRTGDWISILSGKDMQDITKTRVIVHGVGALEC